MPTRPIFEVEAASADRIEIGSKRLRKCGIGLLVDIETISNEGESDSGLFRLARRLDEEIEVDAGIDRTACGCFQAFM